MKKRQPASQEFDEVDFAIIEERNKEMKELEHQLILLAEIHNDLSFLVQQQGEHIQTAEKEIETSVTNTFDASVALENAAGHAANLEKNHSPTRGSNLSIISFPSHSFAFSIFILKNKHQNN